MSNFTDNTLPFILMSASIIFIILIFCFCKRTNSSSFKHLPLYGPNGREYENI